MPFTPSNEVLRKLVGRSIGDDLYQSLRMQYQHIKENLDRNQDDDPKLYHKKELLLYFYHLLDFMSLDGQKKKAKVVQFEKKKLKVDDFISALKQLGIKSSERRKVENFLNIEFLQNEENLDREKLEEVAIKIGIISQCQICQFGHVHNPPNTDTFKFLGCTENPKVQKEIYGACSLFLKRDSIDVHVIS